MIKLNKMTKIEQIIGFFILIHLTFGVQVNGQLQEGITEFKNLDVEDRRKILWDIAVEKPEEIEKGDGALEIIEVGLYDSDSKVRNLAAAAASRIGLANQPTGARVKKNPDLILLMDYPPIREALMITTSDIDEETRESSIFGLMYGFKPAPDIESHVLKLFENDKS